MDAKRLLAATWPPAGTREAGGFLLRRGEGGGRRVSSALLTAQEWSVEAAEAAMESWGQRPCFQIWPGEEGLDADLAQRGYGLCDPTLVLEASAGNLVLEACDERTIFCEAPLASMEEIWHAGGIGAARLGVMARVAAPKVWIMGRAGDRAAGCAFVVVADAVAGLHALEVMPSARRRGLGARMTRAAATWARAQGAETLSLAVRAGNTAARTLYEGMGFTETARYHYRERVKI